MADTDATVLIFGETGTGKEVIAKASMQRAGGEIKPSLKSIVQAFPGRL